MRVRGTEDEPLIQRLSDDLTNAGISSELRVMTSAGGVATVAGAIRQPANLLMSGPVAGLMGGLWAGKLSGYEEVITLDVGGTSADIGVAPGGELRLKHLLDTEIAGYHAMIPMAELDTIGAGGGSLAYVDEAGMFHVGPQSAGAVPGPACYMRGGDRPTVTDAMMVLGKLRPESFLAGSMTVDPALAEQALRKHVCEPLGIDLIEAAASIVGVITHSMIQAIELNSVQKGYDPRDFTLVALGGAGGLFVCDIAIEMGIPRVLVPPNPGITSALGLLATDTVLRVLDHRDDAAGGARLGRVQEHFARLDERGREQLAQRRRGRRLDRAAPLRRLPLRQPGLRADGRRAGPRGRGGGVGRGRGRGLRRGARAPVLASLRRRRAPGEPSHDGRGTPAAAALARSARGRRRRERRPGARAGGGVRGRRPPRAPTRRASTTAPPCAPATWWTARR